MVVCSRAGRHCAKPAHDRFGITASTRASFCPDRTPTIAAMIALWR